MPGCCQIPRIWRERRNRHKPGSLALVVVSYACPRPGAMRDVCLMYRSVLVALPVPVTVVSSIGEIVRKSNVQSSVLVAIGTMATNTLGAADQIPRRFRYGS